MAKVQFAELWPQLMGLVPVYTRDGVNGTNILLERDSALFCDLKTKTLLTRLSHTFLIDLRLAQHAFSQVCGRKYAIPVALRPGLVMIPVRSRTARVKDDGTRAYLVKDKIREYLPQGAGRRPGKGRGPHTAPGSQSGRRQEQKLREEPHGTRIVFVDDTTLVVPHRWPNVRDVMLAAELVEREAARLTGHLAGKTICGVRERPEDYGCRKCPRKDSCFPEQDK